MFIFLIEFCSQTINSRQFLSPSVFPCGGGGAAPGHDPGVAAVLLLEDEAPLAAVLEGGAHPVGGAHAQLRPDHRRPVEALSAAISEERTERKVRNGASCKHILCTG